MHVNCCVRGIEFIEFYDSGAIFQIVGECCRLLKLGNAALIQNIGWCHKRNKWFLPIVVLCIYRRYLFIFVFILIKYEARRDARKVSVSNSGLHRICMYLCPTSWSSHLYDICWAKLFNIAQIPDSSVLGRKGSYSIRWVVPGYIHVGKMHVFL